MPKASQFNILENDDSAQVNQVFVPIMGITIDAQMGPIGINPDVIYSPDQFKIIYGGLRDDKSNADSYYGAIRALNRGTSLRINNIKHYTDITQKSTLSATKASLANVKVSSFSANLGAGHTLSIAFGTETFTQAYSVSHTNTIDLLLAAIANNYIVPDNKKPILLKRVGNTILSVQRGADAVTVSATGTSAPTITSANTNIIQNSDGDELFRLTPINPGLKYNDLVISIESPSNGLSANKYFNLRIILQNSFAKEELYENLRITGVNDITFLQDITNNSKLLAPVYITNGITLTTSNNVMPLLYSYGYSGGTDGGAIIETDVIGSTISKLGFQAFTAFTDLLGIANFVNIDNADNINIAGANIVSTVFKNINYFFELRNVNGDENAIIAKRMALGINTSFARCYTPGSGIPFLDDNGNEVFGTALGDVIGAAAYSYQNYGAHYSYASKKRGTIYNTSGIGAGNQWAGNPTALALLAQAQINCIIKDGVTQIKGNFTLQANKSSQLSYCSIRDLINFVKKSLSSSLQPYFEEPDDIPTWIVIHNEITPFFNGLQDARALKPGKNKGWIWQGDQDAPDLDHLTINDPDKVALGEYTAKLSLAPINSLQIFNLGINIKNSLLTISEQE